MRTRFDNAKAERGSAMVIALMVVALMLSISLGAYTFVDTQQRASADERVRDDAYNLAEAALESAVQYLGSTWPGSGTGGNPQPWGHKPSDGNGVAGTCGPNSSTGAGGDICPDPTSVTGTFNSSSSQPDYGGAPTWTTTIRDNGDPSGGCSSLGLSGSCFYRESTTGTQPQYDANGDNAVWVRAQATVPNQEDPTKPGRTRILVALVKRPVATPGARAAMWGGQVTIATATNGVVVDTQGTAPTAAKIFTLSGYGLDHTIGADAKKQQVQPWTETIGLQQLGSSCVTEAGAVVAGIKYCFTTNAGAVAANLRSQAQAAGTYYAAGICPTAAQLNGAIVYIEGKVGGCFYQTGTNTWNSAASPGMIVMGKFEDQSDLWIGGTNSIYYGLIYDANETNAQDGAHVQVGDSAEVVGAIINEYGGGITITSTHSPALKYDPNVFARFDAAQAGSSGGGAVTGPPKMIQGTFREVPSGS